jgi:SSS family solute:Na+ symporter
MATTTSGIVSLSGLDVLVIVIYLLVLVAISCYYSCFKNWWLQRRRLAPVLPPEPTLPASSLYDTADSPEHDDHQWSLSDMAASHVARSSVDAASLEAAEDGPSADMAAPDTHARLSRRSDVLPNSIVAITEAEEREAGEAEETEAGEAGEREAGEEREEREEAAANWESNDEMASSSSSTYEYFLANRDVKWWAVGFSLFSSNIGSEHLVGLAGSGALSGLAVGNFEWLAVYSLLLLGWAFLPLYLRTGVYTTPEFLERRFNPTVKLVVSSLSLLVYIFMRISTSLFSGAVVLNVLLGWDVMTSSAVMVLATGAYVITGGLAVVIYTEVFQSVLLLLGSLILVLVGMHQVGGWQSLVAQAPADFFHMVKPASDPVYPWPGIFGAMFTFAGVWYWCTDQASVQRALGAQDIHHGRLGTVLAGFLKITPVFLMVLPGIIARVLFPEVIGVNGENSNSAYPVMVAQLLPSGVRGLMIAAMLSALMSSLAAVFNSSATLFTMDCWRSFRPHANDQQLVWIGRLTTAVISVISVLWAPLIPLLSAQVWVYGTMISSYLSPPIMCVSVFGIVWGRANEKGALAAMIVGFITGVFRFSLDLINGAVGGVDQIPVLRQIISINYLEFGVCSLFFCLFIMIVVSLLSEPPRQEQIERYTFFPRGFGAELHRFFGECRRGTIWYEGPQDSCAANGEAYQHSEMANEDDRSMMSVELSLLEPSSSGQPQNDDDQNRLSLLRRNRRWNIVNFVCTIGLLIVITTLVIVFA